jgi:hypothetical protein
MSDNRTATAALVLDTPGSYRIEREELAKIPVPAPMGEFHKPVQHIDLVQAIEDELTDRSIRIVSREFGVARKGLHFFGAMVLEYGVEDTHQIALGMRSTNDMTLAIQLVVGAQVFVCSNLVFSGQTIALHRKHTTGLDLASEVDQGIDRFFRQTDQFGASLQALKQAVLTADEAKCMMFDSVMDKVIPASKMPDVAKRYFEPPHAEYGADSRWTLHNAYTDVLKEASPAARHASTVKLGAMFQL